MQTVIMQIGTVVSNMNRKKNLRSLLTIFLCLNLVFLLTSCGDDAEAKYENSLLSKLDLNIPNGSKYWSKPGDKTFSIEVSLKNKSNAPISEDLTFYAITRVNGENGRELEVYKANNIFDSSFTDFLGRDLLVELNPSQQEKLVLEFEIPFNRYIWLISTQSAGVKIDPSNEDDIYYMPSAHSFICWDSKGVKFQGNDDESKCPYSKP